MRSHYILSDLQWNIWNTFINGALWRCSSWSFHHNINNFMNKLQPWTRTWLWFPWSFTQWWDTGCLEATVLSRSLKLGLFSIVFLYFCTSGLLPWNIAVKNSSAKVVHGNHQSETVSYRAALSRQYLIVDSTRMIVICFFLNLIPD